MRVELLFIFSDQDKGEDNTQKVRRQQEWLTHGLKEAANALNGNLSFGDGSSMDNIAGKWVNIPDTGNANTDFTVAHNFGQIPPGYIVAVGPKTGWIYKGNAAWTTSNIYLRCPAANETCLIFVLANAILTS